MPCYNASKFIRDSIDSVLSQTYTNFELILINDGSTDDSQSIIDEYLERDKRIRSILKPNSGITDTLNVGLGAAKGKWIARLDADDIAMPSRFQKQIEYVEKNPGTALLGSGCILVDEYGNQLKRHSYGKEHDEIVCRMEGNRPFFPHSSAFFLRSLIQEIGGYSVRFNAAEDLDLWLRVSSCGTIACLLEPLIKLRKHSDCITVKKRRHYKIFGFAAIICYFRSKLGLSRPSEMDGFQWREFLQWVEGQLEDGGYFENLDRWEKVKALRYRNDLKFFEKGWRSLLEVSKDPLFLAQKAKTMYIGSSLPEKLAKESSLIWTT